MRSPRAWEEVGEFLYVKTKGNYRKPYTNIGCPKEERCCVYDAGALQPNLYTVPDALFLGLMHPESDQQIYLA